MSFGNDFWGNFKKCQKSKTNSDGRDQTRLGPACRELHLVLKYAHASK